MHYLSEDQLLAVGASQLYSEAYVFTGKLYDQAYVAHRNEGYGQAIGEFSGQAIGEFSGQAIGEFNGQATGEFNGKEINCTISNRCINGKLSRNTSWKINGKRISQKQLMRTICSP